ncbi:hypothetical protein E2C01_049490 [Portunus trituberculatus]|uniref:Uncharacterized protein n=1 Tax=Portunus trituberculatus TaxID=210409 RepID=A0A5B7G5Q0_PORTR|nr:hypothetical protein [Portunus trituberculatus]
MVLGSTTEVKMFHSVAVAQVKERWHLTVLVLGTSRRSSLVTTALVSPISSESHFCVLCTEDITEVILSDMEA